MHVTRSKRHNRRGLLLCPLSHSLRFDNPVPTAHVRAEESRAEYRNQFIIEQKRFMASLCPLPMAVRVLHRRHRQFNHMRKAPTLPFRLNEFVHLMHVRGERLRVSFHTK